MHIFIVWTIIMQSLNAKEWKLLELQSYRLHKPDTPFASRMEQMS